jgi:hypothetical protein
LLSFVFQQKLKAGVGTVITEWRAEEGIAVTGTHTALIPVLNFQLLLQDELCSEETNKSQLALVSISSIKTATSYL